MDPDITFVYQGKTYTVSGQAYTRSQITLPDGRVLNVLAWGETYPPQPLEIEELNHAFKALTPAAIALVMNSPLAEEVQEA